MTHAESEALHGAEHVHRYRETDGRIGHDWKHGSSVALLKTHGRKTGLPRTHALIYGSDGTDTIAVVASDSGAPRHPAWYLNLVAEPEVEVQVKADKYWAIAHTANEAERAYWWPIMTAQWPDYDVDQARTDRQIPVVVLERSTR